MGGPKLIGMAKSRAFRALWMLEEIGIPYQYINAQPQTEEVKRHNPLGKIPILVEEDGFVLYESGAILTYLGDKYRMHDARSNNLVPLAGTKERGLYEQTMSVLLTELDAQGLWIHRKHEAMGDFFTHIPEAVEHARKYFNKTNRMLIQQLKNCDQNTGQSFLLGSNFTAVDIVYVQCLDWSKTIGWNTKWKDDETVVNYVNACKSRRAYSQILANIKRDSERKRNSRL